MAQSLSTSRLPLNTGSAIPAVGFGTRGNLAANTIYKAVREALEQGYRHIDTAFAYGCENEVGQAIKDSKIARSEIWVTTKLDNQWHHKVNEAVQLSLDALDTGYIDLYLMHWPCPLDPHDSRKGMKEWHFTKTWSLMQRIPKSLVRNIGVANFDVHNLDILLSCPTTLTVPSVNQIEIHPYWPCDKIIRYCQAYGIHCTAYSPLGSRQSTLPEDPVLQDIAELKQRSVQQILLMWGLQRGYSVIPGSTNPRNIQSNRQLRDWSLTENEMSRISSITSRFKVYDDVKRMKFPIPVFLHGEA